LGEMELDADMGYVCRLVFNLFVEFF